MRPTDPSWRKSPNPSPSRSPRAFENQDPPGCSEERGMISQGGRGCVGGEGGGCNKISVQTCYQFWSAGPALCLFLHTCTPCVLTTSFHIQVRPRRLKSGGMTFLPRRARTVKRPLESASEGSLNKLRMNWQSSSCGPLRIVYCLSHSKTKRRKSPRFSCGGGLMGMWALRSDGRTTIPTESQASCQGVPQISRESRKAMRFIGLQISRFVTRMPTSSRPSSEGCPALP